MGDETRINDRILEFLNKALDFVIVCASCEGIPKELDGVTCECVHAKAVEDAVDPLTCEDMTLVEILGAAIKRIVG